MSDIAVKRCEYQFETATGRCCLPDGHKTPDGKPSKHELWKDEWVDRPMAALDPAVAASLLRKESGPVSPDGAFLSMEQLTRIVAMRKANRDSLWRAALEKHVWLADRGTCSCETEDVFNYYTLATWIEHVAANLEDIRS